MTNDPADRGQEFQNSSKAGCLFRFSPREDLKLVKPGFVWLCGRVNRGDTQPQLGVQIHDVRVERHPSDAVVTDRSENAISPALESYLGILVRDPDGSLRVVDTLAILTELKVAIEDTGSSNRS
jgi:hypothetical protein